MIVLLVRPHSRVMLLGMLPGGCRGSFLVCKQDSRQDKQDPVSSTVCCIPEDHLPKHNHFCRFQALNKLVSASAVVNNKMHCHSSKFLLVFKTVKVYSGL